MIKLKKNVAYTKLFKILLKNNMIKKRFSSPAFTLIELLVVIAIFALIANITMYSVSKTRRQSRDVKRVSDIKQLRSALYLYSIGNKSYPSDGGSTIALGVDNHLLLDDSGWNDGTSIQRPVFMYQVPRDPSMITQSNGQPCTASSAEICDYSYTLNSNNDYIIYFYLEGPVNNLAAGLHSATKATIK